MCLNFRQVFGKINADEKNRTSTRLLPQATETCASTSSRHVRTRKANVNIQSDEGKRKVERSKRKETIGESLKKPNRFLLIRAAKHGIEDCAKEKTVNRSDFHNFENLYLRRLVELSRPISYHKFNDAKSGGKI